MRLFSSDRERRLWLWALAVVVAIYATLDLAGTIAENGTLSFYSFMLGLALAAAAIVVLALRVRPRGIEIGVGIGVATVYLAVVLRLSLPERSHLFEYGIVAVLIYEALKERQSQGRQVPAPAIAAILAASFVGVVDEGVQAVLPNRVFDVQDIGFNALAALMAVGASVVLAWARRQRQRASRVG